MHSQCPALPRDAPHPFNQTSGDVTLRTSDSVHFHIRAQILSQASPVFAAMFGLPQPLTPLDPHPANGDISPNRPVIDITEDSQALEPLLRVCYPVRKPELQHLDTIQSALEAAIKYDMEWPTEVFTARLLECAWQAPLRVWVFGCRHGLEHVARRGAEVLRASLSVGVREKLTFFPNIPRDLRLLDGASSGQYFRLLQLVRTGDGDESVEAGSASTESAADTHLLGSGKLGEASLLTPPKAGATPVVTNVAANRAAFRLLPFADIPQWPGISEDPFLPDIICRCKDKTEFKAHQTILSLYSPVLRAWIAAMNASRMNPQHPQWHEQEREGVRTTALPVLDLDGPSTAISTLLGICYHDHYPKNTIFGKRSYDCIELLAVATKYKIQLAIDLASVQWKALVPGHPHFCYFIARKIDMRGAAVVAATAALQLPWKPEDFCSPWLTEMEDAPARTYHQLAVYFDACSRAAAQAVEKATKAWKLTAAERSATVAQFEAEVAKKMYQDVTDWLNCRREALKRLAEVAPKADLVRAIRLSPCSRATGPPSLLNKFKDDFENLVTSLPLEIDVAISKVKLDLR